MDSVALPELLFYEIVEENSLDLEVIPKIIFSTPDKAQALEYFQRLQTMKENDHNDDVLYRFVTTNIRDVVGYRAYCYWPVVQDDLTDYEAQVKHLLLNPIRAEDVPKMERLDLQVLIQKWESQSTLTDHLENGPFVWCYGYSVEQAKERLKERLIGAATHAQYQTLVQLLKKRQALWNARA